MNYKRSKFRWVGLSFQVFVTGLFAWSTLGWAGEPITAEAVQEWREDLRFLTDKIIQLHPDPFFSVSERDFFELRDEIDLQIPLMDRSSIILSYMRLLALIGVGGKDGHSGLWPYQASTNFHLYPLRLYWFDDGIYIVDSDHNNIGAKLLRINGYPVEELLAAVDPYISRDGPMWVRSWAPIHILSPEFHRALEFGSYDGKAKFEVMDGGVSKTFELQPIPSGEYHIRFPMTLYTGGLPTAEKPRYLHREDAYYWFEEWSSSKTLYFQYNAVTKENQLGTSLQEMISELRDRLRSGRFDRLIVDVRSNGGGDNTVYGDLVNFLEGDPFFETSGHLFVIIGRMTFSAGINFVTDVESRTNAIFVGEATGGSPNQFGDPEYIKLPNSGITARVSTRYWNKAGENDQRLHHEPDLPVPVSAADYFENLDAAVDRILERYRP